MSQLIEEIEADQLKKDIPDFKVGDTVSAHIRIIEVDKDGKTKERVQVFTGVVIARKGSGLSETVSIYRVAYGSAMERVIPLHSPRVSKFEVIKHGKVRKGKLYYLRGVFGKKIKIKERILRQVKSAVKEEPKVEKEPPKEESSKETPKPE